MDNVDFLIKIFKDRVKEKHKFGSVFCRENGMKPQYYKAVLNTLEKSFKRCNKYLKPLGLKVQIVREEL